MPWVPCNVKKDEYVLNLCDYIVNVFIFYS